MDVTGDNTMDGDKDYAKVYVNTPMGLKSFKITQSENQWGEPFFSYTDKVVYQHKVYAFRIPLESVGLNAAEDGTALQLAFAVYGTLAPATVMVDPQSTGFSAAAQNVTLTATVTDGGGSPIASGQVTFQVKDGMTDVGTAVTDTMLTAAGVAEVTYVLPAGTAPGAYTIEESYTDGGFLYQDGMGTNTLTVTPPGTIIVEKQTLPDGAMDSFSFTGDAAGSIQDGQQITVANLVPGTYTSTETVPAGWVLTSIACDDANSSGNLGMARATFNLEAGETVTCTFTNAQPTQVGFSKSFLPDTIGPGSTSTLRFDIDNTASAVAASALDFTDNLPAGLTVANPANASATCTGGTITATAGTGVISYTGGSVAAGIACTVQVDVGAGTDGVYVNTSGDLTSSSGNSGTASATLTVNDDGDGVPGIVEDGAPNGGDGNNDGTPDRLQSDVSSLPGANGEYLTLIAPPPAIFTNVAGVATPGGGPAGTGFPWGFLQFQVNGVGPGGAVDVELIVHTTETLHSYWKFGPEPGDASDHFYEFLFDAISGTGFELNGNTYTLHLVDRERGDDNLTVLDGIIIDDGAPSVFASVIRVPTLGQWALLLLLVLLGAAGLYVLPRKIAR